jgi:GH15 family glucan-1,4-alpha-glucosidase
MRTVAGFEVSPGGRVPFVLNYRPSHGLVMRYTTATGVDRLPPGEGAFLPCSFWLADSLAVIGRPAEAEALFERLLALRNDVGLLGKEFDPGSGHMRGNFPQALSHMALINTARVLSLPQHTVRQAVDKGERPGTAPHAT